MQKTQKRTPFATICRKVIPWLSPGAFNVHVLVFGLSRNAENAKRDTFYSKNAEKSFLGCLQVHSMFTSFCLGYPKMQKMQKKTHFEAKNQKNHSLPDPGCIQRSAPCVWVAPPPWVWVVPKCRKCRKGHPLQQKCRKVIPRLDPNAFNVHTFKSTSSSKLDVRRPSLCLMRPIWSTERNQEGFAKA